MTLLDPHLDVDQLSAAVDGGRDPAAAAHLLACLSCRQQVDAWRRTLATLRDVPTVVTDVGSLIDGAMASWTPPASTGSAAAIPMRRPERGRDYLRRLRPPPSLAAVVVLAVFVAAAIVGLQHRDDSGAGTSASKSSAAPAARVPASHSLSTGQSASGAVSAAPSAGSFSGTVPLAAELRRVATTASTVDVATPCYEQARRLAGRNPAVASAAPTYTEVVRLAGVEGRVFVFAGVRAHVAVVVGAGSCSLLATVVF